MSNINILPLVAIDIHVWVARAFENISELPRSFGCQKPMLVKRRTRIRSTIFHYSARSDIQRSGRDRREAFVL